MLNLKVFLFENVSLKFIEVHLQLISHKEIELDKYMYATTNFDSISIWIAKHMIEMKGYKLI